MKRLKIAEWNEEINTLRDDWIVGVWLKIVSHCGDFTIWNGGSTKKANIEIQFSKYHAMSFLHKVIWKPMLSNRPNRIYGVMARFRIANEWCSLTGLWIIYRCAVVCGPPYTWRTGASQHETLKQETHPRHPLFNHIIPNKRLKSGHSFLHCVNPFDTQPYSRRVSMWQ